MQKPVALDGSRVVARRNAARISGVLRPRLEVNSPSKVRSGRAAILTYKPSWGKKLCGGDSLKR